MAQEMKYDIFISYRREGGKNIARLLKTELGLRGYHAFLDFDELKDGRFDKRIMDAIDSAPVFMFILSDHALDRCVDESDWVRKEIEYAMATERHIIPINPDKSFNDFPDYVPKNLKDGLGLHQFSQLLLDDLFNQTMDKLIAERLEPVLGKRNRYQMSTTGATIHLSTDANCEVYRFGKHECNVVTGEDKIVYLKKGKHKFEFISIDNEKDKYSMAFTVEDIDAEDLIEITLLPIIHKREQEEYDAVIRARREDEEKRQAEEKARLMEARRLQEEKERKEAEKVARMQEEQRRIREQEELKRQERGKLIKASVGCICCIIGIIFWLNPALMIQNPNKLYDKGWNKERKIGKVKGADKDAFQYYRKAAKKEHPAAMNRLGVFYMDGIGTKQKASQAIKWFNKAIESGNVEAVFNLGFLYETGKGVEKDYAKAMKYYAEAAERGLVKAQIKLGACYKAGTCGVAKNQEEALKWYKKAADQGNEEAKKQVQLLSKTSNSANKKSSSTKTSVQENKKISNNQQTTNHELKIYVTPANAVVKVVVEGKEESWSVVNGCATKKIPHGTYYCTVSADGYYPYEKHITFTSSDNSLHINLVKKRSSTSSSSSYTSSNSSSSSSKTSNSLPAKEMHNGHEYIDLGLSVKWATCNLGANDAENYGNHYGWGGDAARTNWGGNWRMPTDMEWIELRNSCTWSWTKKNGVGGYLVKSRKNSNTIFLPAAGYSMKGSSGCYSLGAHGYYWSSTMDKNNQNFALGVQFDSADKAFSRSLDRKNLFCSIRPVFP